MNFPKPKELKAAARTALGAAGNHRQLVLIWAGVNLTLSLIVSGLSLYLDSQIANTGGLSGIGLRSTLTTVQAALALIVALLTPFWDLGYTAAALRLARKQTAAPATLLEGFRRFFPAARLYMLQYLFFTLISIVCIYGGVIMLCFTPLALPMYLLVMQNPEAYTMGTIDEAAMQAMTSAMTPVLIGALVLWAIVIIPLSYKLRLSGYLVVDKEHYGGLTAIIGSWKLTKKKCLSLLRLDLSFWWYYLAQALLTALCYGDMILPVLGISLPFNQDTAFYVFLVASLAGQLGLYYLYGNYVQTTYAKFYDAALTPPAPEGAPNS